MKLIVKLDKNYRYFQHFKGGIYRLLNEDAKYSETLEPLVVYQDVSLLKIWVRPRSMFFDKITRDGNTFNRFKELTAEQAEEILNNK